ncbi:alpha/beta hydrolase [Erysipelothrix sp. HDW6C]|uniref:alpha/beta hydrolase n=1 Tax=Erysipelothrix sp. HDW6C TaxID=2714930 RepID=UPI00140BA8B2|nr:alpha/beta hydrolase [Erysipelothrix sp. HDW6C]QIK69397.1 alpha/beta hydrolase [Erysipelothrix sp. HDW6C]
MINSDTLTLYATPTSKFTLFYFHGGGLIFGSRNDLPKDVITFFNNQAITIIAIDYPLAPEMKFDGILASLKQTLTDVIASGNIQSYGFFGRSAGAFLALQLAAFFKPKFIISFYGYSGNRTDWMSTPNRHYLALPKIPERTLQHLISPTILTSASVGERYSLYVHSRQTGVWLSYLGNSLPTINLDILSPVFAWHSIFDPDVPYIESSTIVQGNPQSVLVSSSHRVHELDVQYFEEIKTSLLDWLNKMLTQ